MTKNLVPGESVYGEKRINIEVWTPLLLTPLVLTCLLACTGLQAEGGLTEGKIEYRVWNPFRSKLAAAILGGVENIHIQPGSKVLYLGAASGTTVSHVADIVGPVSGHMTWSHACGDYMCAQEGLVYAVEFSHRSGRDLINVAKKRTNIIPVIEDARHPHKYRMLLGGCGLWPCGGVAHLTVVCRYGGCHIC